MPITDMVLHMAWRVRVGVVEERGTCVKSKINCKKKNRKGIPRARVKDGG